VLRLGRRRPTLIEISVLIPTRNGGEGVRSCLDAVFSQSVNAAFEVIVVDSGSNDGTWEIASSYPARIYRIPPETFHHARTRNYLATLAQGKYLVYLNQDAFPTSPNWLQSMISNFSDETVGAVYGRQLPKPGSDLERQVVLGAVYGVNKIVKEPSRKQDLGYLYYFLSTANAAIRKDVWAATGFPEELRVYEDIGIAKRILDGGWKIVYEPDAAVYHSHNHSLTVLFKRYFDGGVVRKQLGIWDRNTKSSMFRDGWRLLRSKLALGKGNTGNGSVRFVSIAQDTVKYAAMVLGRNEHLIPLAMKRRMSAFRLFG